MKRIITIMVLGFMFATVAMADGPKYGFASRPSSSYQYGSGSVRNRRTLISNKMSIDRSAYHNAGSRSASSLGLSSSASAGTSYRAGSSSFGGGSGSAVYGRTSGASFATRSGYSSGASTLYKTTSTGLVTQSDGEGENEVTDAFQEALEGSNSSGYYVDKEGDGNVVPLGDAILPLLLLMLLVAIYKWRVKR